MKHPLLFLLFLLLNIITGCEQEKDYTLVINKIESSTLKPIERTENIKAANDSIAYQKGLIAYFSAQKVYNMSSLGIIDKPVSFNVLNAEGSDIALNLQTETKERIDTMIAEMFVNDLKPQKIIDPEDEKKAYGELSFGMTERDFGKIKGWDMFQKIGSHEYTVHAYFDDSSKLYLVEILGRIRTANYYDSDVRDQFDNLVEVIQSKYGYPDKNGLFPTFLSHRSGYIQFAKTWALGDKIIDIGVGERESTYYATCRIYSDRMRKTYLELQSKSVDAAQRKDAEKF